ncbi:MAG: hypothetical protein JST49_16125 [Bacteroidetes bacterium]|nr:hypothetical protein [Bacteroidota bacterium]
MKKQNYGNHIRWYIPHHFVFYPVILAGVVLGAIGAAKMPEQLYLWLAIIALFLIVGILSLMLRQHYALGNQDRIVRLEMRLRYFQLTGKRLEEIESQLGLGRVCALRFASDAELPALVQRALAENLSADEIKKAVKNWQADDMRR